LIAIEQAIGTRSVQETGIKLDSAVTPELLANVFSPHAPLHDGGLIIAGNRIVAARCMFPLSEKNEFSSNLGTRHRAAVGLSEETDAVVVVVSEETGAISVSHAGRLIRHLDEDGLRRFLSGLLPRARKADYGWERLWRFISYLSGRMFHRGAKQPAQ
jgi:diadenylate cyclase